eukprot:CAMPEP_0181100062 /NCGR_PEP_ID=MMETSP1071-20121207/12995_1 /TAXON_ID=35127 /ORGANISM="Thalassiosira sp., Strain NH16" /LENGTH=136 /DNA_ID=CAMNT_0023182771 /DNA_START=274 /DNA_END=680 /DNA_ORIENTATION=-
MRNCQTIEEAVQLAYDHVDSISPRGISAFWASGSKLLQIQNRGPKKRQQQKADQQISHQFDTMIARTMEHMDAFNVIDLAQTAISLAKIVKFIERRGGRLSVGRLERTLQDILIGNESENKQFIFDQIALASIPVL